MTIKLRNFLAFCSDLSAPFRTLHIKPIWNTLHVQWKHDYYLCRNFTIYLDDTAVPECTNITALNCTIRNLNDGVQYEVKVAATELDTKPVTISQNVTTLDSRSAGASMYNYAQQFSAVVFCLVTSVYLCSGPLYFIIFLYRCWSLYLVAICSYTCTRIDRALVNCSSSALEKVNLYYSQYSGTCPRWTVCYVATALKQPCSLVPWP